MACCIILCSSLSKESNSNLGVFVRTLFFLDCVWNVYFLLDYYSPQRIRIVKEKCDTEARRGAGLGWSGFDQISSNFWIKFDFSLVKSVEAAFLTSCKELSSLRNSSLAMLLLFLSLQRLPEVDGISFSSFWLDAEESTEEDISFVIVDEYVSKMLFDRVLNEVCRSGDD